MDFNLLNIGHDAGLLASECNEVKNRQVFYSNHLNAKIFHIVKAKNGQSSKPNKINNNVIVYPCHVKHWVSFPFKALLLARKILRSNKVELIQVQEPYLAGIMGLLLSKMANIPLVVGLYSDEIGNKAWIKERRLNYFANMIGTFVLRNADAIRSDSRTVAENVSQIIEKNVAFIPFLISNADDFQRVDSEKVASLKKTILGNKSGPVLFAANRLESEKNVSMLLQSVAIVKQRFPSLTLMIAGSGRMQNELIIEGERLLGESVHWLGWVGSHEIANYYHLADLFLITSNRESAARVLYESILTGTPIVSTNTAGANEVIDDGINGKIVSNGDVVAFANAVIEIISNKKLLDQMSTQASIKGNATVSNKAIIDMMKSFYSHILEIKI